MAIGTKTFEVGVKIALDSTGALAGIALLSGRLTGLGTQVDKLAAKWKNLGAVQKTALVGLGVSLVGLDGTVKLMNTLVDSSRALSDALTNLRNENKNLFSGPWGGRMLTSAQNIAKGTTQAVPGTTELQALNIFRDSYSVTRSFNQSKLLNPLLAQYMSSIALTNARRGNRPVSIDDYNAAEGGIQDLVRAAEMTGHLTDQNGNIDLNKFRQFANLAAQVQSSTGGMVNSHSILALAQQGGPSLRAMDDEGLLAQMLLGMFMGPGRAGTAWMSLMQQMGGGTMWTRNAAFLEHIGMLGKMGKVSKETGQLSPGAEWGVSGSHVVLSDEASKRLMGEIKTDPVKFVQTYLLPALRKAGFTGQDDEILGVFKSLTRQTSQRAVADLIMNMMAIKREVAGTAQGAGLQSGSIADQKSISKVLIDIAASWENIKTAFADPDKVLKVLHDFSDDIASIAKWSQQLNSDQIDRFYTGIKALGLFFVGGTAVALLGAMGPAGWLIGGIAALGVVITKYGPQIDAWFKGFQATLQTFWDKLKSLLTDRNFLLQNQSYMGPGIGGGGLSNVSYETGGGGSSQYSPGGGAAAGSTPGAAGSVASNPGSGVGRSASVPNVGAAPMGSLSSIGTPGWLPATGSILGGVDRSQFSAELKVKPWLINKMAAMTAGEVGGSSPDFNKLTVLSEAFNRAQSRGISLEQALLSVSENPKLGYYAGRSAPGGGTYGASAMSWARTHLDYFRSHILGPILGGWDKASKIAGFEITGNASGSVAAHQIMRGTPHIKIGAETYFHEGPFPHAIPHLHGDDIHTAPSAAIPAPSDKEIHLHNSMILDGRVIARNTMKHMMNQGNSPAASGRLSDISVTRPMSI